MGLTDIERIIKLSQLFLGIIKRNLENDSFLWLENRIVLIKSEEKSAQLSLTFAQVPRFATKEVVKLEAGESSEIEHLLPGYTLDGWTIERLCRVWILMQISSHDKDSYIEKINNLFAAAEMNEQVALYSALPLFNYAEEWISKCEEGIRSNIGTILEAIMYHNPYPARFLAQGSWNQLVLKAFFTEKDVHNITGLHERLNRPLLDALNDYVQERLAAHRSVNPEIYKLTNKKSENINS